MKKTLLLLTLMFSVFIGFSQFPCVQSYKGNNGGGNCGVMLCNGVNGNPTGTITVTFDSPLGNEIPSIFRLICSGNSCLTQAELDNICFVFYSISADRRSAAATPPTRRASSPPARARRTHDTAAPPPHALGRSRSRRR